MLGRVLVLARAEANAESLLPKAGRVLRVGVVLSLTMIQLESAMSNDAFAAAMTEARLLLRTSEPVVRTWPTLLAALAFAICALGFATAAILAPPVQLTPIPPERGPV
jgi:hypothetical protein